MQRLFAALAVLTVLLAFGAPRASAQVAGQTKKYTAGWNLVSAPPGTIFNITSALYTAQPNDSGYQQSQPSDGTTAGFGYWANVGAADASGYSAPVTLTAGSSAPYTVPVPSGQWVMVGDPSGMLMASIQGADVSYVFDPVMGFQASTILQPGQGAWVGSSSGAVITVAPIQPSANAQSAYASPLVTAAASAPVTAQVSVSVTTAPPNPVLPVPNTSYEPVPSWTYWPFQAATGWAPAGPAWTGSSAPYYNWSLCPGYIVTGFALDNCGGLLGQPGPSAP